MQVPPICYRIKVKLKWDVLGTSFEKGGLWTLKVHFWLLLPLGGRNGAVASLAAMVLGEEETAVKDA